MGPGHPPRNRPAHGLAVSPDGAHRARRRRAGAVLLHLVFRRFRAPPAPLRGGDGGVRRCHVRPRGGRQPGPALHLLGDHLRPELPAGRPLRGTGLVPPSRHAGAPGHHARRPGDARRHDHPRPGGRDVPAQRDRGRATRRNRRPLGTGAGDPRRHQQIGHRATALLAPRRHDRAHPGQRLPALGSHGQSRCLPHRRHEPRDVRLVHLAAAAHRPGAGLPAHGRLAGTAGDRPQAGTGVRNGLPAGLPAGPGRDRLAGHHARRAHHAAGALPVQIGAVHVRRRDRQDHRHPRDPGTVRARPKTARPRRVLRPGRRVDGRTAALPRVRRQRSRVRHRAHRGAPARHAVAGRHRRPRGRLHPDLLLHRPPAHGRLPFQAGLRGRDQPGGRRLQARRRTLPVRARAAGHRRPGPGTVVGARRGTDLQLRGHRVPARQPLVRRRDLPSRPVARPRHPAGAHRGRLPAGHHALRRPAHRRAHAVRVAGARQRRPDLRRGPAVLRRALPAPDRQHPTWLAPADPRDHPAHPRAVPVRLAARRHPRGPAHGAGRQPGRADRHDPHDHRGRRGHRAAQPTGRRDRHVRDRLRRGRGVRLPRSPGPRPDPGARRDPHDGHLRAGPAHHAGRGAAVQRVPSAARLARDRGGSARRRRRRLRHQRPPAPGRLHRLRRHRLPDRQRCQRRQRHARRHPRLGHPRRDHGAARGRDRRRQPRLPQPTLRLRPAHRRCGQDPLRPARNGGRPHRHRGARGLPRPLARRRHRP